MPVVILTGHATIDLAIRAIKEGAENFLAKPVELPALQVVLERAIENSRNRKQRIAREARQARRLTSPFLGESRLIRDLEAGAHRLLTTDRPVLLLGETGAGKGVLAAWLHASGPRANAPLVDLNCAGFTAELLESELFGHERGAFTGAVSAKAGLLEVAHRGTVFLDEIAEMDLQVQPKLLKVLEEHRLRRLGDLKTRAVDFRLIAASHRDLASMSHEGRFRSDLYFRLSTLPLRIPALRERTEDIPILAQHILQQLATELGKPKLALSNAALIALRNYAWPGNIRELRNVLERAVLLYEAELIAPEHLSFDRAMAATPPHTEEGRTLLAVERDQIQLTLAATGGKVDAAARLLGVPLSSLYQKLKRHGIQPPRRAHSKS
jgi:DNA-binding NtrC family response regulator